MPRHMPATKDAGSGETPGRGAPALDPWKSEWDNPSGPSLRPWRQGANPGNRNIQVPGGKEINRDSLSSGERSGKSPNRIYAG